MNKRVLRILYMLVIASMLIAACTPGASTPEATESPATEAPATEAVTEAATEAATEAPTETPALVTVTSAPADGQPTQAADATPTLVTVSLPAPVMEVGSTYTYMDGSVLVAVPEGEFTMGNGMEDAPIRKVFLNEFWIHRNEVSNRAFALCVALGQCTAPDPKLNPYFDPKLNPSFFDPEHANDPVVGVNWDQATAYCKMIKGRLPTEAEWEKTARGPDANMYPWGKTPPSCTLANIGRCNPAVTKVNAYAEGKSFYDALNLAGNVYEWTADWYSPNYYSIAPTADPNGPETGSSRSVRSAGFRENSYLAESARRFRFKPTDKRDDLGFRCVIEDPQAFAPWCEMVAYVGADAGNGNPIDQPPPKPTCDNLSGSTSAYCNTNVNPKQPAANLNFNPNPLPPSAIFTVPAGCSLDLTTADPNDYYCTGGGPATVQGACTVPAPPVPAGCPAGYVQDGNTCKWAGSPTTSTECLPGVTYDPLTQCCGSMPGMADSFTLCPADAPYYAGGVCMPWPVSDWGPLVTINVALGTCNTGGGNNNNGGCQQQTCGQGFCWDQAQCACLPSTNGGCN